VIDNPAPLDLDHVLHPAWLTAALSQRYPGVHITSVDRGPVISRVSTNARFRIHGELPDGLTPDLCVKGYFNEIGQQYAFLGAIESAFYRDLAPTAGVRTLKAVYADVDPATQHGVVITEDVVAQGAQFLDALSDYSPNHVAQSLSQLAKLHASTWRRDELLDARWLDSRAAGYTMTRGVAEITSNFTTAIGAGVPAAVRDPQRVFDGFNSVIAQHSNAPEWCVIHGDAHLGNWMLDGQGRPSLLDWQLVMRGPWYLDVGYHLASALPIEQRRQHEGDLLRHYLNELTAGGVPPIDEQTAWAGARVGMLYGFYLWAITLKVDPAITTELNTRLGTAVADHNVLQEVLG